MVPRPDHGSFGTTGAAAGDAKPAGSEARRGQASRVVHRSVVPVDRAFTGARPPRSRHSEGDVEGGIGPIDLSDEDVVTSN